MRLFITLFVIAFATNAAAEHRRLAFSNETLCAIDAKSSAHCWRADYELALLEGARAIDGNGLICAATTSGEVRCLDHNVWTLVPGIKDAVDVAVLGGALCVLDMHGAVFCRGSLQTQSLTTNREGPNHWDKSTFLQYGGITLVISDHVIQLDRHGGNVCALTDGGEVSCWGMSSPEPHSLPLPRATAITIVDGTWSNRTDFVCARKLGKSTSCVDINRGAAVYEVAPAVVSAAFDSPFGAGCIDAPLTGAAPSEYCARPRLFTNQSPPVALVRGHQAVSIAGNGGPYGACVLEGGTLTCWRDKSPMLLTPTTTTLVDGLENVEELYPSDAELTCARQRNGAVYCWGGVVLKKFLAPTRVSLDEKTLRDPCSLMNAFTKTSSCNADPSGRYTLPGTGPFRVVLADSSKRATFGLRNDGHVAMFDPDKPVNAQLDAPVVPEVEGAVELVQSSAYGTPHVCARTGKGTVHCFTEGGTRDLVPTATLHGF